MWMYLIIDCDFTRRVRLHRDPQPLRLCYWLFLSILSPLHFPLPYVTYSIRLFHLVTTRCPRRIDPQIPPGVVTSSTITFGQLSMRSVCRTTPAICISTWSPVACFDVNFAVSCVVVGARRRALSSTDRRRGTKTHLSADDPSVIGRPGCPPITSCWIPRRSPRRPSTDGRYNYFRRQEPER